MTKINYDQGGPKREMYIEKFALLVTLNNYCCIWHQFTTSVIIDRSFSLTIIVASVVNLHVTFGLRTEVIY